MLTSSNDNGNGLPTSRKHAIEAGPDKPTVLPVNCDGIPAELKERERWVLWRYVKKKGRWAKMPFQARCPGRLASTTDPKTWASFDEAVVAYERGRCGGLGYVITRPIADHPDLPDDGIVGVDLDDCRDPVTGELTPWAAGVISSLGSYAEVSPTGTGVKVLALGKRPQDRSQYPGAELFDRGRYFALTGQRIDGTPTGLVDAQTALNELVEELTADEALQHEEEHAAEPPNGSVTGHRPESVEALALAYLEQCPPAVAGQKGHGTAFWAARVVVYGFALGPELGFRLLWKNYNPRCDPPWSEKELMHKCRQADIKPFGKPRGWLLYQDHSPPHPETSDANANEADEPLPVNAPPWPDPPAKEVYHGLAGQIIRTIEPASEADPVGLLVQLLVGFGNVIGHNAHWMAEADPHYGNLFAVLVGRTSKGRKGTSWGHILNLLSQAHEAWAKDRIATGLSSGEGVIWEVRDAITKHERIRLQGQSPRFEEVESDPGVSDKRLLVVETEFASALRVVERQGNTLSPVLRNAWDGHNLRSLTKNSQARATGAHISLIGHVTADELRRYLSRTEIANGYGNRHLWVCVKRSKLLPDGGRPDERELGRLGAELSRSITFARQPRYTARDEQAKAVWHAVYGQLSEGGPGLVGALLGRAEAHVMRLAMLYALLDRCERIGAPHLMASLALWQYVEQSIRWIWGDSLGDPMADDLLRYLRGLPGGATRTEIRDHYGRHNSEGIGRALGVLAEAQLVVRKTEQTGGRPVERWQAVRRE
jgi:hypothetical protein